MTPDQGAIYKQMKRDSEMKDKYTKKRTHNGVRQVYNTQTGSWETYLQASWNTSLWDSISVVEDSTNTYSNSSSSSSDYSYSSDCGGFSDGGGC